MEMVVADAKICVLDVMASRDGCRVTNGLCSYFKKANAQINNNLKPSKTAYIPQKPLKLDVGPKERMQEQVYKVSVGISAQTQIGNQVQESQLRPSMHFYKHIQEHSVGHVPSQTPMLSDNNERDIVRYNAKAKLHYHFIGSAKSVSHQRTLSLVLWRTSSIVSLH